MRRLEPQLLGQERETHGLGWQHQIPLITPQERIIIMLNTVNCKLVKSHSDLPPLCLSADRHVH